MPTHRALASLVAIVVLVVGCSAPSTGVGPSAAAPAATSTPAASGDVEAGVPFGGAAVAIDLAGGAIGAAAAQEQKTRADGRTSSGMAEALGPDSALLTAAMDAQMSNGLGKLVDATATPAAVTGSLFMPSGHAPLAAGIVPPGMSFLGPAVAADMIVDTSSPASTASSRTDHQETQASIGPNTGTITTDSTVTIAPSGSRLAVDVQSKISGSVSDATGKLIYRIEGTGHAHIDLQACPDASGVAMAVIDISGSEYVFISSDAGRSGHSWTIDQHADAKLLVDDQANLSQTKMDITSKSAVQGGTRAAGAGQSSLVDYTTDGTASLTVGPDFKGTTDGTVKAHNTTLADAQKAYGFAEELLGIAAFTAGKSAEKFWRSGKCIEVLVEPNGGSVAASSKTNVNVSLRHRFEGTDLTKPVQATLSGSTSIEPAGAAIPAPAIFTYTAGPKPGDAGSVTFKSVSNRGIGETTVTFTVGGGWSAAKHSGESTIKGQKCDGLDGVWKLVTIIKNSQLEQTETYTVTIDGTTLVGSMTVKGITTSFPGIVTTTVGGGHAAIVLGPDGTVTMTFSGTKITNTAGPESVTLALPNQVFSWAPGGTCP